MKGASSDEELSEQQAASRDVSPRFKSSAQLRFLKTTGIQDRSRYPLLDIDRAMEDADIPGVVNLQSDLAVMAWKTVSKLRLAVNIRRSRQGPVIAAFMGFSEFRVLPLSFANEVVPYCFDCWPMFFDRWLSFFQRHRVRTAFISARQSAEYFAKKLPDMKSIWLPEATDPSAYSPSTPWAERDIDVLELSRRDDDYHDRITEPLARARKVHLYMRRDAKLLFQGRAGLADGLSRTKISLCFPKSQTHPALSGGVETTTHRYFESIASKCLIVGQGPRELIDLFGYNPVVEVEVGCEAEQLQWLLNHPEASQELIDCNYRRLLEIGTWRSRLANMIQILRSSSDF